MRRTLHSKQTVPQTHFMYRIRRSYWYISFVRSFIFNDAKETLPQLSDLPSLDCESCNVAKHHHIDSSSRVNRRAKAPFELVHSDVWEPCPVTSKPGFWYFVAFVDDYSNMTRLYLMKKRSQLFTHFCAFCAQIRTLFNVPIKVSQSDNAKEYL